MAIMRSLKANVQHIARLAALVLIGPGGFRGLSYLNFIPAHLALDAVNLGLVVNARLL